MLQQREALAIMSFLLGYQALTGAYFGQGSGPILLDNVNCNGCPKSLSLFSCSTGSPIGQHDCRHSEDVGVRCQGTTFQLKQAFFQILLCSKVNPGRFTEHVEVDGQIYTSRTNLVLGRTLCHLSLTSITEL